MKPDTKVLNVQGNLQGERVEMKIDTDASLHLITVLTDLYRNPRLAVIREYSTNAHDAHVDAGVGRPIEVTLPSALAPFFKVRDYGYGLNGDDIRNLYSLYGASRKRDNNDAIGKLGLGCKSALTYTDQFTVRGVKDGIATEVSVSREEDGRPVMTIVNEYETDDPSGVEITIPVKLTDINGFQHEADSFFRFWEKGTVLVNGKEPKLISGIELEEGLLLTKETDSSMVVMGNVAYPFPHQSIFDAGQGGWLNIVAFVKIGEVEFTPSREDLQMIAKTKAKLEEIKERVEKLRNESFKREIDASENFRQALYKYFEMKRYGYTGPAEWKGVEIPTHFEAPATDDRFQVTSARTGYGTNYISSYDRLPANGEITAFVVGYEDKPVTPHKRKKLIQWHQKQGWEYDETPRNYAFVKATKLPFAKWIDPKYIVKWDVIKAEKIERKASTKNGGASGSYRMYVAGQYVGNKLASEIDTSNPIFYATYLPSSRELKVIIAKHPKATIVEMTKNRVNKFKREFPTAKTLQEAQNKIIDRWAKTLSEKEKLALYVQENERTGILSYLDPARVDDPALKEAAEAAKFTSKRVKQYHDTFSSFTTAPKVEWKNPLNKYPLLTSWVRYGTLSSKTLMDHLYIYLNAAYAAERSN